MEILPLWMMPCMNVELANSLSKRGIFSTSKIVETWLTNPQTIEAAIHLWKVDKVLSFVARRRTFVQGNLPNSMVYRNVEQYPNAKQCSWNSEILILEIDAPIYFANNNYLREKHTGWRGLDEGIVVVGTCMI
ncbi:unnamed protein product [Prunus armeniaca]